MLGLSGAWSAPGVSAMGKRPPSAARWQGPGGSSPCPRWWAACCCPPARPGCCGPRALRLRAAGGESQCGQNVPRPASASRAKFGEVQRSTEMKNYFCSAEGSKIGCPLHTGKLLAVTEDRFDSSIFYNSARTSKGNVVKLEFKTGRHPISSLVELPKKKCGFILFFKGLLSLFLM